MRRRHTQLLTAVRAGTIDGPGATQTLAAITSTDAAGATWSMDPSGRFLRRSSPGAEPEIADPSRYALPLLPEDPADPGEPATAGLPAARERPPGVLRALSRCSRGTLLIAGGVLLLGAGIAVSVMSTPGPSTGIPYVSLSPAPALRASAHPSSRPSARPAPAAPTDVSALPSTGTLTSLAVILAAADHSAAFVAPPGADQDAFYSASLAGWLSRDLTITTGPSGREAGGATAVWELVRTKGGAPLAAARVHLHLTPAGWQLLNWPVFLAPATP